MAKHERKHAAKAAPKIAPLTPEELVIDEHPVEAQHKPKQTWLQRHLKVVVIALVTMLLAGCGTLGWALTRPQPIATVKPTPSPTANPSASPTPSPNTKASPLTGVQVAPDVANRPVVSVVIENYNPDARPQSGLADAGVVYEANAEGGITRFQAFYLDRLPPTIGPVLLHPHLLRRLGLGI